MVTGGKNSNATPTKALSLVAILEQVLKYNATFLILKITKVAYEKSRQKVSFDFKLSVIDEIHNGLISINHASKIYKISRNSIRIGCKNCRPLTKQKKG